MKTPDTEHSETKLQHLYQARKQNVQVPIEIKQKALATAAKQTGNPWRWLNWQSAALLFAVVIIVGQMTAKRDEYYFVKYRIVGEVTHDNEVIYHHNIAGTRDTKMAKSTPTDPAYQEYLNSLAQLSDRKTLHGTITATDESVTIEVCQLGLISLSQQILKELNVDLNQPNFRQGKQIVLYANNQGFITGIDSDHSAKQCNHLKS